MGELALVREAGACGELRQGEIPAGVEGAAAVKEFADAGKEIKEGLDGK